MNVGNFPIHQATHRKRPTDAGWEPHQSESVRRPVPDQAGPQIRGIGQTVRAIRQGQRPEPDARAAGALLINEGVDTGGRRKTFIFVNNRLEGNALDSIAAMLEEALVNGPD